MRATNLAVRREYRPDSELQLRALQVILRQLALEGALDASPSVRFTNDTNSRPDNRWRYAGMPESVN